MYVDKPAKEADWWVVGRPNVCRFGFMFVCCLERYIMKSNVAFQNVCKGF